MEGKDPNKGGFKKLLEENKERLKELACINKTTAIIKEGKGIEETFQKVVMILPEAWQFPKYTVARIRYEGKNYVTAGFKRTDWVLCQEFDTLNEQRGRIEVFYTREFKEDYEGPFLNEERHLIDNVANLLSGFVNSKKAKEILERSRKTGRPELMPKEKDVATQSRKLLQQFLTRQNSNRDILHDLMPFKVKEILLIANLYDAYSIEREGRFADHVFGEYHQLSLASVPRITGVSTMNEALDLISKRHFDLIIIMVGVNTRRPLVISRKLKELYPYLPIFLLLNNSSEVENLERERKTNLASIDKIFVWNGESKIFFAMVKLLEDRVNVKNDTEIGLTRVILLVEDSTRYYSRYLPMLYSIVLEQTRHLIEDVSSDELYKVLKLRTRPKIILASTFEEALEVFNKYRDYMLCLISDMRFPRNGEIDPTAGYALISKVQSIMPNLPTVLQSSDEDVINKAYALKSSFINKNSESLLQDLKSFINYYLGFGDFVYRNNQGQTIAVAKSMREFEEHLKTIPEESLLYHALKNHFSLWLMARGEIQTAKIINPLKVEDFKNTTEMRDFLTSVIREHRREQDRGKIVPFNENALTDERNIVNLASGNLGGKGRGLAFINSLIYNFDFTEFAQNIFIRTPKTSVIGTDEYDLFLETNKFHKIIHEERDYQKIRKTFVKGRLSYGLRKRLRVLVQKINKPLAVRSSSLLEDSLAQPFSGIFDTYILPNNDPSVEKRVNQLMEAIKLVYASIFSPNSRTYFQAIHHQIEEEKMAVIIQELVGNTFDRYYYPHISGTAQSHNFYPVAHMKPDEGFSVIALGLGHYVVEGEKAFRFSPSYPKLDVISPKDLYKSSQLEFYAVDLEKENLEFLEGESAALSKLEISLSEKHGTLKHCASVYDPDNDIIQPGLDKYGPRIVNFANILKYEYIPLADTINRILDVVREALGVPVEIEFAIDLNKDKQGRASFYLLQVKPMVGHDADYNIDLDKIDNTNRILLSHKSMGNGIIENIRDVIFVKPEQFKNTETIEMTYEVEKLNKKMLEKGTQYVLIGPGRWGTRDRYIGIPVTWSQISNAKVIVEMGLDNFPLDASLGSHFFHNVTSMNVGYFSIQHRASEDFIHWDCLQGQELIEETMYFKHVRFEHPLSIIMDGKKRISVILQSTGKCKE